MVENIMSECTLETKWVDNVFEIDIVGRLTYDNIPNLKELVQNRIVESQKYMINLSRTSQIDSTGLGLLITITKYYLCEESRVVIINTNPLIRELFSISKLYSYFAVTETVGEAVNLLEDYDNEVWENLLGV